MTKSDLTRRNALIAGGLGAVAVAGFAEAAAAASVALTDEEKANVQLITAFCHSWNDPDKSVVVLAPDSSVRLIQDQPALIGPSAVAAEIKKSMGLKDRLTVKINKTFAKGPIVINVRTETLSSPGKPDQTFHQIGVFYIKNGKIQEWNDYVDA